MTEPVGSHAWLAQAFDADVRDELFTGHAPDQAAPVLVLLGGQPAPGKTRAQRVILREHAADDLVEITGDDLREYHPDYARLADHAPLEMPAATAPVSGGLVSLALDHALAHRYSVLLEGTFRDVGMVTATATRFAEAGYRVEVVAVATPAAVSRLSAEMRSLDAGYPAVGRWTPPQAHESALLESAGVVAALEALPHVQRMQVFSREQLLFDNTRTDAGDWERPAEAAAVLRREQHRPFRVREAFDCLQGYAAVFAKAQARPGYLGRETAPAYIGLQRDAQTMIRTLSQTPGAPLGQLEREQRARRKPLERVLPTGLLPPQRRLAAPPELPDWPEHPGPTSRREPPTLGR